MIKKDKCISEENTTEYAKAHSCFGLSDVKSMTDEELLKSVLSYMFTAKEYKEALSRLEGVPFVSELMNPDALFTVLGGISKRADSFIKAIKSTYVAIEKMKKLEISDVERFELLLMEKLGSAGEENVFVLFLNDRREIEHIANFSMNEKSNVGVEVNKIINTFKKTSAKNIVVAHNHPSGSLTLSQRDYLLMCELEVKMGLLGVPLKEHYLVSATGCKRVVLQSERE